MPPMPPVTYATRFVIARSVYRYARLAAGLAADPYRGARCLSHTVSLRPLYCERHAHTAADTQRRQSFLRIAFLHFMQQRDENPAAGRTNRMTDRDRPARSEEHTSELQSL